jgi:UPF0042 nucleotide-binding protein
MSTPDAQVRLVSFGFLHGGPPPAHVVLDLRHHFRDPHVRPELQDMTARDPEVVAHVLDTPGIPDLIDSAAALVRAYLAGPCAGAVVLAVGCTGGRHRAPATAGEVARRLHGAGIAVDLTHRDIDTPRPE